MSVPSVETPAIEVTADLVATLVSRGGYTHPLFHRPAPPLPGQAVLLLMGGLVERSGALDHAIALLELRRARFHAMVTAGATLRVRIAAGAARTTSSGTVVQEYAWTAVDGHGSVVADVEAVMLVRRDPGEGGS
jgi:acyl dehydratase